MFSHSIRRSLASTLLLLAVIPLAISGSVLTWHSYITQKQQAIRLQEEIAKRVADEIYRPIQELQYDMTTAADIFNVINTASEERNNLLRRIQHHANLFHGSIIQELVIVDTHGMELNKVSANEIYTSKDLKNISHKPEFLEPINSGRAYYSPIWFEKQTGDPLISLSIPWYNVRTMSIDAILICELRLKNLWYDALEIRAGKHGRTFIIDSLDRVVAHRNPSVVLRGTTYKHPEEAGFQTGLMGDLAAVVHTDVQLGDQTLHVISEQPARDALDLTISTVIIIISVMLAAVIMSIAIGYVLVRRTINPIEALADTARAISQGDLTRRAVTTRSDETAVLADAFNNMTEQLVKMISDLENNMIHIDHIAHYDRLTNLPNRRMLEINLGKSLSNAKRHGSYGALIFIDLDHFKNINDSLGHPVGDSLLVQVAKRLFKEVRNEDTVARLGGDEFVVVLNGLSEDMERATYDAQHVAEKLRLTLAAPYELKETEYRTTASIGVTMFPHGNDTTNELIKHADTAMYSSKGSGRNTVRFFHPDMQLAVTERLNLERLLHEAIDNEELVLNYQPFVNAKGEIIGVESLLRWPKAKEKNIGTEQFIALAEETGLIIPIGSWVLKTACTQFASWRDKNIFIKDISVNVSYRQFHEENFVDYVINVIRETGIPPDSLKLEITESIMMSDIEDTIDKMSRLKSLGIRFSIDDFGTGYSSLNYLSRLPLDILKIDQSFVRNLPYHKDGATIVETIIAMASNLKLDVIAEGVETESQLEFLKLKGCGYYQGYLFSRPLSEEELLKLVVKTNIKPRLVTTLGKAP